MMKRLGANPTPEQARFAFLEIIFRIPPLFANMLKDPAVKLTITSELLRYESMVKPVCMPSPMGPIVIHGNPYKWHLCVKMLDSCRGCPRLRRSHSCMDRTTCRPTLHHSLILPCQCGPSRLHTHSAQHLPTHLGSRRDSCIRQPPTTPGSTCKKGADQKGRETRDR